MEVSVSVLRWCTWERRGVGGRIRWCKWEIQQKISHKGEQLIGLLSADVYDFIFLYFGFFLFQVRGWQNAGNRGVLSELL